MANADIEIHLRNLGFTNASDYLDWCSRHGFKASLEKSQSVCLKEHKYWQEHQFQRSFSKSNKRKKSALNIIRLLVEDELNEALFAPAFVHLRDYCRRFSKEERSAFFDFLKHLEKVSKIVKPDFAVPQLGEQRGNTYIEALAKIFDRRGIWRRDYLEWRPATKNLDKQFSSLTRFLFAKYEIPLFLDHAWFANSYRERDIFIALAKGHNIRKINKTPFPFTKKMAHAFLQAPNHYTLNEAYRWAEIMSINGDIRLIEAVNQSRLGGNFEHRDFWFTVLQLFARNPMLDRRQVAPIIDYIYYQKFEGDHPPQPGFSMRGRTPTTLLRQTQRWHAELNLSRPRFNLKWAKSKILPFVGTFYSKEQDVHEIWRIVELTSSEELFEEGNIMDHCVATYDQSCKMGYCTIWSMRAGDKHHMRHEITIDVDPKAKIIREARGKRNAWPSDFHMEILKSWALREGLRLPLVY